jgi:thiamine biosynthesis lipoprotein
MIQCHHLGPRGSAAKSGFCLLAILLTACAEPQPQVLHGPAMGTTWSVHLGELPERADTATVETAVLAVLAEMDATLSTWNADSEISRLNRHAGSDWVPLSAPLYAVLDAARTVSARTDGVFDITVAPLITLWGFGAASDVAREPTARQIDAARSAVGMDKLALSVQPRAARKLAPGLELDVSGIAPGYAVDRIARALDALGYVNYLIEIGGEVRCRGRGPHGGPWRIAIERPSTGERAAQAIVVLDGLAISTSGDYRDYRIVGGRRISHTIDPRSGAPVDHALASVSVIHDSTMLADAYATALMVLGPQRGLELAERLRLPALFVERKGGAFAERATRSFARFRLADHALPTNAHN